MSDITEVLEERGKNYGNYHEQCMISQGIKAVMINTDNFEKLDEDMTDALEMMAVKISRILNGDPWYADNWVDIAGYAKLVGDRLETL